MARFKALARKSNDAWPAKKYFYKKVSIVLVFEKRLHNSNIHGTLKQFSNEQHITNCDFD